MKNNFTSKQPRFLLYWFWVWPIASLLMGIAVWLFPASFSRCNHAAWVCGLLGLITAGWTSIRTRDKRYLPSMIFSMVMFAATLVLYLRVV